MVPVKNMKHRCCVQKYTQNFGPACQLYNWKKTILNRLCLLANFRKGTKINHEISRRKFNYSIYAPMIYTAPRVRFLMRADI